MLFGAQRLPDGLACDAIRDRDKAFGQSHLRLRGRSGRPHQPGCPTDAVPPFDRDRSAPANPGDVAVFMRAD
ncbi:hypothetical protein NJB18091_29750 [Mycobacterium marinum]|nr:hypothetical protein NJB18091_29750 [Mycobacterium marinum]